MNKVETQVNIFIGPGGVGKTTLSASYALKESQNNLDKKYKMITIDPSKRLRDVFSMEKGESERFVSDNLSVSLNQRNKLFEDFLESSLTDDGLLEDFYKSSILKSLLDDLSISQEFTTFYELVSVVNSREFDHVIIDTPPLQNTSDFMTSVDKLESLFGSKVIALFFAGDQSKGLFYRMIHASRRVSFKLLQNLTGEDFVKELELFFKVTEILRIKILDILKQSKSILSKNSSFNLVCNHTELSLRALSISLWQLEKKKSLNLKKVYVNKFDNEATRHVQGVLEEIKSKIKVHPILKTNEDLSDFENLVSLLDQDVSNNS